MPRRNAFTTAEDAQAVLAGLGERATIKRKRNEYDAAFPAVACRLPKATADELRTVATTHGLELGQMVAMALSDFLRRYNAGEVRFEAVETPTMRREVRIAP